MCVRWHPNDRNIVASGGRDRTIKVLEAVEAFLYAFLALIGRAKTLHLGTSHLRRLGLESLRTLF